MNAKPTSHHPPGITLGDIYYILFRHKWMILAISAAGLIIGLILPLIMPHVYGSEAKLLIKYVLDNRVPTDPNGGDARVTLPDAAGRNIINTELQILSSLDLAQEVATNVGPDKILGKSSGDAGAVNAAVMIHNNLTVENLNNGDVIRLVFKHRDPVVVREVLEQIIRTYEERHTEIHQPEGGDEALSEEARHLKSLLTATEEHLREAKTNLNIVSLEETRSFFSEESKELQKSIYAAEADLAAHQSTVDDLAKRVKIDAPDTNTVNTAGTTNSPSPEKVAEYKHVVDMVDKFRQKESELRMIFLTNSVQVKDIELQIAVVENQKKSLESANPGLAGLKSSASDSRTNIPPSELQDKLITETSIVAGLQGKINVLSNQLANIHDSSARVEAGANNITELERQAKLEEDHWMYYLTSLDNYSIDTAMGPGKGSNISEIQSPSPPFPDNSIITKLRAGFSVGGIALAIGLAFLIEMYLDHTLKRPIEIEARLGIPLLLSIPYRNGKNGNGHTPLLTAPARTGLVIRSGKTGRSVPLLGGRVTLGRSDDNTLSFDEASISVHHCEILIREGQATVRDLNSSNGTFVDGERITEKMLAAGQTLSLGEKVELDVIAEEVEKAQEVTMVPATWNPRHALRPFYDALRDRLITYFEVRNLKHKPKLVALTSCRQGAGVSSIATGLAAALSETGEGNVLLVDMNERNGGAAHYFHKGSLSFGLDDALRKEKRHEAQVQNNLYVVTEGLDGESIAPLLPKRFTTWVPQLRASDYDYIIFDMPPLSEISVTPRLARFMDMVMLVIESEKTDRDVVRRATSMLTEVPANIAVVLNKRKKYVPQRLQQEL